MSVRPIVQLPDPRLREPSTPVTRFDPELKRLIDDLFDTLYGTSGIGLSAPQLGELWRVAVMDLSGDATAPQVYVNPEIVARKRWGLVEESCLSVPGIVANVLRATRVRVRALDRDGCPFERDLEDMNAVCMQHEVDHLDGKLFIDRLSFVQRLRLRLRGQAHLQAA